MAEDKKKEIDVTVTEEYLKEKLYKIRGKRVLLDADLAEIYGYDTKGFNRQVKKSANLYARIEPDVKEQAEGILAALGIPASNAINMFYKQIILQRGLPFEVKMPSARPVDVSALSEAQMNAELEKGYADMQAGRTRSAKSVFADIRKDYNL